MSLTKQALIPCILEDIGSLLGFAQQLRIRILKRRKGNDLSFCSGSRFDCWPVISP
jgi:hypothetical protein